MSESIRLTHTHTYIYISARIPKKSLLLWGWMTDDETLMIKLLKQVFCQNISSGSFWVLFHSKCIQLLIIIHLPHFPTPKPDFFLLIWCSSFWFGHLRPRGWPFYNLLLGNKSRCITCDVGRSLMEQLTFLHSYLNFHFLFLIADDFFIT